MTTPADESAGRKLAAIMFTDIKGFSKKMGENEARAFELLKTHDGILRVIAAKFGGKVIKSIGDSFMIDFASAVNAVRCAIDAQKRFWSFNTGKPEFDKIEIRVGIHMGDVIIRDNDIFGDGVNIASRIESITEPTRICISSDVYGQVRNKIPLNVYKIGALELKNIAEPVEVYEILIDSIPELAQPSRTALERLSAKIVESGARRQEEEEQEAKLIEDMRKQVEQPAPQDQDKQNAIESHYQKAEKFFQLGKITEAERELNEIYKLDPAYQATIEKRRQEQEHERSAQVQIAKARELLAQGNLESAEAELNEVFRFFPLHMGAQQLLMQVEEARYKKEESQRVKPTEAAHARELTADQIKIEELMSKAGRELEQQDFREAVFTLREVFKIDPNNSAARRLEESIREAEQAKAEMDRLQVEEEEQKKRTKRLELLQQKVEKQKLAREKAKETQLATQRATMIRWGIVAVVAIAILLSLPTIRKTYFPKTATVAVLSFSSSSDQSWSTALSFLSAEDLGRIDHIRVVYPTSALPADPQPSNFVKTASVLGVRYLIAGTVDRTSDSITAKLRLLDVENQTTVASFRVVAGSKRWNDIRWGIASNVVSALELPSQIPPLRAVSKNTESLIQFAAGIQVLYGAHPALLDSAIAAFRSSVNLDSTFVEAYEQLSLALLDDFLQTGDQSRFVEARRLALRILGSDSLDAVALYVKGETARWTDNFDEAKASLSNAVAIQPNLAPAFRSLAMSVLAFGDLESAFQHSQTALLLDDRNPESHLVAGIVRQLRREYGAANGSFKQAIALGLNDSLTTSKYLMNSLLGDDRFENVVHFCGQQILLAPEDYRYYYWIGRAYQMWTKIKPAQDYLEQGLKLSDKAAELNPNDPVAFAYNGLFLSRLGRFADGQNAIKRALEISPDSPLILYRAANIYSIQKNKQMAEETLKKALRSRFDLAELLNSDLFFLSTESDFVSMVGMSTSNSAKQ